MAKLSIRKGDRVKVISGNYKGTEGTVLRVERDKGRVVVQGVNVRKRHRKPTAAVPQGEIVEFVHSIYRGDRYRLLTHLNALPSPHRPALAGHAGQDQNHGNRR